MIKAWLVMTVAVFLGIGIRLPFWIEAPIFVTWIFLGVRVIYRQMKED